MSNFDIGSLMKNAKKMQEIIQQQQAELETIEVTGNAGAGSVEITMSCKYRAKRIKIDPEMLKESPEILEDLLTAAINNAVSKIEKITQEKMMGASKLLGGGGLGDLLG